MNFRDLEYVCALAETGHFGRAAAHCHVSQPTLSMQVAKLERELGVTLFERGGRRATLTPMGREIVVAAGRVQDGVKAIQEIAKAATEDLSGPIYLGVIPTIGPYLLPQLLPEFRRVCPQVQLYLREEITARLMERLQNAELDAVIVSPPIDTSAIETETLCEEEFVALVPAGHALAKKRQVTVAEVARENLLLLEEGNCIRDQTLEFCRGTRVMAREEFRASSVESLRQMVGAGIGCTFLPKTSTAGRFANAEGVAVLPLVRPAPKRGVVLAWRRSYPKSGAMRGLGMALRGAIGGK